MLDIIAGYILDLILGDPQWSFHPVRCIGKSIRVTEGLIRRHIAGVRGEKAGGVALAVIVVGIAYFSVYGVLKLASSRWILYHAVNILFIYFIIAVRDLHEEAMEVFRALEAGDVSLAREMLSRIVGRDTCNLDENEIIRAAVETVAENTSDGVIAPLFYICLGGAPLGMAYKAVNTLDSMVGYKNDRYRYLGWASARLDDLANYLPARVTGVLVVAASLFRPGSSLRGWRTMVRDGRNHSSPNSGYPEAAVAGCLGIRLGGTSYYFGEKVEKPTIGDAVRDMEIQDIRRAIQLMYTASILFMGIMAGVFFISMR